MEEKPRDIRICASCKAPCVDEFKKVAGLQNSGLQIFVHKEKNTKVKGMTKSKKEDTFILHNAGDKEIKRADYIEEISQYRTKCFQCKTVIQRVRSLLDEITDIKKNEVLGICEHCKRANPSGKCRRCEYIVNKFLCNKVQHYEDRQNRFKSWLSKVNQLLHCILESADVCEHELYKDSSTVELERLLQELKSPLEMRQPDITFFPADFGPLSVMTKSKEILEELLIKLKSESFRRRSSDDSLYVSPSRTATSCVCKYFKDKKFENRDSMVVLPQEIKPSLELKTENAGSMESVGKATTSGKNLSKDKKKINAESDEKAVTAKKDLSKDKKIKDTSSKEKAKTTKEKTHGKENVSPDKEPKEKKIKEGKPQKPKLSPEEEMLLKMVTDRKKDKMKNEKSVKQEKVKQFAKIESLPQLKIREVIEVVEEKSESVVECGHLDIFPTEMIKGAKVVTFDLHYKDQGAIDSTAPLLFKIDAVCPETKIMNPPTVSTATTTTGSVDKGRKSKSKSVQQEGLSTKGIIKYELSNREFIEKGWTILPTTKIMRRMNIYKMEPASPKYDWFEQHKNRKIMFYNTGERLAEIGDDGRGKWFYKNGMIALDYYNAQELNTGQRYVIYSSGEEVDNGKKMPVTVLASFDFLGNGVVYDHYGKARLKYNQSEGIVIDEKIGPRGRWKWHSLNEPPILQPVFLDSHVEPGNPCLDNLLQNQKDDRSDTDSKQVREPNAEMLAIEFENFVKEKAHKLLQKFKPYQIRMKVLKVNEQFSLRVLDQANIYLLLRDGPISLKLNMGMLLNSSEIIDTDTAEVSEVATPYDRIPPKTPSVAEIQFTLNNARRIGRARSTNSLPRKKPTSKSSI